MISMFLVLSIIACVISFKKFKATKDGGKGAVVFIALYASLTAMVISFACVLEDIQTIATAHTIDEKIQMYQQENESIEQSVGIAVRAYMDYEQETFGELSNKDAMNLVSLYPDLKSDQLVQKQIDIYVSNNNKIKELREDQIDLAKARWNLYFGR